jgi:hypothetical protein
MKKNFVKKTLASTLALAMVATSMPAAFATADAAKAPALNKKAKTLYINENEIGSSFNFNVKNTVKGSTYKWTTSNKAVATVNAKNGVTKAGTKTGKATISCKITFKTKKTKTLKATVTVKENATKVAIKNAPEKEIGIGENAYDFNSTMTSASGAKATDYRTWEIDAASNTAGATINAKSGKVTTTKAGTFKVRVRAYQNKAKLAANDTVDSDWLEVKVASSIKTVAQSATSKVLVTFDDNMKETVKAADFVVANKTTSAVNGIKEIAFSDDGKAVTITTYGKFDDKGTYTLTYAGKTYDFATTIGSVESIELATTTIKPNETTVIKYVLKNANGVDITDTVDSSQVIIEEVENANGYFNAGTKELTIYEKGKTAKLKLTYHSQTYNKTTGVEEGNRSVEGVVTCAEETASTIGAYEKYTISDSNTIDWAKVTTTTKSLCVNDTKYLFVKAKDSKGNDATGLKFKSGNDNILLVDSQAGYASLLAVKEGTTVVNVYTSNDVYLWSLPVEVKSAAKATSLILDNTSVSVANNSTVATKIGVTVKNQHGDNMSGKNLFTVEAVDGAPAIVTASDDSLSVQATSDLKAGTTYKYKVTLTDNSTKYTYLTVAIKEAGVASGIELQLSKATLDTTVTTSSTLEDLTAGITLVTKDSNGLVISDITKSADTKITVEGPTGFKAQTIADGKFNAYTTSGSSIIKVPTGTYKITAQYVITDTAGNKTTKTTGKVLTITDTQTKPTATVTKTTSEKTTIDAAIKDCVTVKSNGTELPINSYVETHNGKSVSITSVSVVESINSKISLYTTIEVGKTITYNK